MKKLALVNSHQREYFGATKYYDYLLKQLETEIKKNIQKYLSVVMASVAPLY